jgi:UDP-galactopyranose mutase
MISKAIVYGYTNKRWGKHPSHKRLLANLLERLEALHEDVNESMLDRLCRHIELELKKSV